MIVKRYRVDMTAYLLSQLWEHGVDPKDFGEVARWSEVEALLLQRAQEIETLKAEIAEAREACPSIRRQDYFDAPLLKLIELEVSRGFNRDAEIERLSALLAARAQAIAQGQAEKRTLEVMLPPLHNKIAELKATVKSIATMLGWENVPPQRTLEADIAALKARAADAARVARVPQPEQE